MMDKLRTASGNVVLKVLLIAIALSFLLSGIGNYLVGGGSDYVVKVNGEAVSRQQLDNVINNLRQQQQMTLGEQYAKLASEPLYVRQLRDQALNQLIDQSLVQNYLKILKMSVSDDQIKKAILSENAFAKDGKFDNKQFHDTLAQAGFTPDSYATALGDYLANQQFVNAVLDSDFMLKNETQQLVGLMAQQRVVRTAIIDINKLSAQQSAPESEITHYYQENKNKFITAEQYQVRYIKLDAASLQTQPDEEKIKQWYQKHLADYSQPARFRYSLIRVKTKQQAESILQQIKNNANFAELARAQSLDKVSAEKGGDLGWLQSDTTINVIANAHLKTKNQLSSPIKDGDGYLVLKLTDLQAARTRPLSEVHTEVEQKVKQDDAITRFYKLQQQVNDAASNNPQSLAEAEKVSGIKVVDTDWFTQTTLPAELNFEPIKHVLFDGSLLPKSGAEGVNSSTISIEGDRAFVLRIIGVKAATVKPLSEVRAAIIKTIQRNKAEQQAGQQARKLISALKSQGDQALAAAKLQFSAAKTLKQTDQNELVKEVFALEPPVSGKSSYGSSMDAAGNLAIIALDQVIEGKLSTAETEQLAQAGTNVNAQAVYTALLKQLRQNATIKYGNGAETD